MSNELIGVIEPNKLEINVEIIGAGPPGTSFKIKGLFPTLEDLIDAHPQGVSGDACAVGTESQNVIYIWSEDQTTWVNIGSMRGPQGPPGSDAEVTEANIEAALGYTPADEQDLASHLADITAHNRTLTYLTYYVNADTGNDNNQGTIEAPFKTIKKAIDSIPIGTVGWVRLLGGTAFSIDTPIYVYNKVVALDGWSDETLVHITSTIHLIDSTFSINNISMYAETSDALPAIFYCSGIVGIKCGGYYGVDFRPLQETSNVNFIYVSAVAEESKFFSRPVAIYLIGDRLYFGTDNYPSYSGTFNVFAKVPYYTFPVVFTRWWQITKDANVNWGATEYQLGSSGTSLWYF